MLALGIFLCLKRGGASGSSCTSVILMIRCMPVSEVDAGVYRTYWDLPPSFNAIVVGRAAAILPAVSFSNAARVRSVVDCTSSAAGRSISFSLSDTSVRLASGTRFR